MKYALKELCDALPKHIIINAPLGENVSAVQSQLAMEWNAIVIASRSLHPVWHQLTDNRVRCTTLMSAPMDATAVVIDIASITPGSVTRIVNATQHATHISMRVMPVSTMESAVLYHLVATRGCAIIKRAGGKPREQPMGKCMPAFQTWLVCDVCRNMHVYCRCLHQQLDRKAVTDRYGFSTLHIQALYQVGNNIGDRYDNGEEDGNE